MRVNNISFGKQIPLMKSQVKDLKNNKFIPVTFSEFDCKDYDDIEKVFNCRNWHFSPFIAAEMNHKRCHNTNENINFYVMEDNDGNIIGLCETERSDHNINIKYIESKQQDKQYKYIGQTMLAMIGKILQQNNGHNIYVTNPAPTALRFYTDKCGFKPLWKHSSFEGLILRNSNIDTFILQTENKTECSIKNI